MLGGYKQLALQFEALSSSVKALWASRRATFDDQEVPGVVPTALLDDTLAELYPGDREEDSPVDDASASGQPPEEVVEEVFPGLSPEASAAYLENDTGLEPGPNEGAGLQEPLLEASKPVEGTSHHGTEDPINPSPPSRVQTADAIELEGETTELTIQQENDHSLNEEERCSQHTEAASQELSLI